MKVILLEMFCLGKLPCCDVTPQEHPEVHLGQLRRFSFEELQVATDYFSNKNILGKGGFGKVYKGRLKDGSLVAVKRLQGESTEGGELQFRTEVEIFSMAFHPNLLWLRGLCTTPTERILVYPYMANGSVASCLRGGTIGYIAPEYWFTWKSSVKTDVYGYGVMLLELITGRTLSDLASLCSNDDGDVMLFDWVKGLLQDKKLETLVDANMQRQYVEHEVEQLIQVTLLCTQGSPKERPKMAEVVSMLEGDGLTERDLSYKHLSGTVPVNGSFSLFTPIGFAGNANLTFPATPPSAPAPQTPALSKGHK